MGEPNQHDAFHITAENLTSRSSYAFSNFDFRICTFMEDNFHIYRASCRLGTFIYW